MTTLTPVLTQTWGENRSWSLDTYERFHGYDALRTALGSTPADIIETVKSSGLRGRGGAGFPTGMKGASCPRRTAALATWSSTRTSPNRVRARTSRC